jgi:sec-independent protein translocase protein TatB
MFDIGWGELVVIGIVALIAIGPKELPTVLRTLGQYMTKIRRMAGEFQGQFQEAMREAEMADLKKQADDFTSTVSDVTNFDPMASTKKEMESAFAMPEENKTEPAKTESDKSESGKSDTTAEITPPSSPEPPPPLPEIDVPLPELPPPVTEKDFAAVEPPPPKQAGGKV